MPAVPVPAPVEEPVADGDGGSAAGRPAGRFRRGGVAGGLLAAAWLLPLATHAVGADAVLVPVVIVAAAGLVRGAHRPLDRLVVASVLLFGGLCVAGLGITWWPWGLHPVSVAGCALTALTLAGLVTGRWTTPRPGGTARFWPRPGGTARFWPRPADLALLGGVAVVAACTLRQFVTRDEVGRLALLAPGEDLSRHFILYDAIGQIGGYAFLRPDAVAEITPAAHANYPQGWHLAAALLGRFWHSSGSPVTGPAAMDWLVWCHVATYLCFVAAVLWALRRIAGPLLTGGRAVAVLGAAAGYLFFGDPVTVLLRGFPNELAGLGCLAVLVALLARPLRGTGEQVLTVAAALVAIGFTYYLFLPVAAVAVLGWLVLRRGRVPRALLRRPAILVAGLAVSAVAVVPALANPAANSGSQLLTVGTAIPADRPALAVLLLVGFAGLAVRPRLRPYPWRAFAVAHLAALGLAGAVIGYGALEHGGGVSYYGEKTLHLVTVLGVLALGATARLLPVLSGARLLPVLSGARVLPVVGGARLRRVAGPAAGLAVALAVSVALGGFVGPPDSSAGGSYGNGLLRGREGVRRDGPEIAYWASRRYPDGAGRITVDLSHGALANFYGTLYGLAMQRTYVDGVSWYGFLLPGRDRKTLDDLERQVLRTDRPVRFVVGSPEARFLVAGPGGPEAPTNLQAARFLAAKYPGRVEVVTAPG